MHFHFQQRPGVVTTMTVLGVTAVVMSAFLTLSVLSTSQLTQGQSLEASEQTFFAAEGGINSGLYRLILNPAPTLTPIATTVNGIDVTYTIEQYESNPPVPEDRYRRLLSATAIDPKTNSTRTLQIVVTTNSFAGGFNYAAQAGSGGIILDNTSEIIGDVYSNGSIVPDGGGSAGNVIALNAQFPGHVWVAGPGNRIEKVQIQDGDAHADTLQNLTVGRSAYYQTKIGSVRANGGSETCDNGTGGTYCLWQSEAVPVPRDLAIRDDAGFSHIQPWVDAINDPSNPNAPLNPSALGDCPSQPPFNNGQYYCVFSNDVTLGRQRINGNLYVGNGRTLTLTGNVYVTGHVFIDVNATVQVAQNNSSNASWNLISEQSIDVDNNSTLRGSGHIQSFLLIVSRNASQSENAFPGGPAIYASNNSTSVIFAAPNGMVKVKNVGHLRATVAYVIKLKNNSDITFNPDIAGLNVPGENPQPIGIQPGSWSEVEP